MAEVKRNLGELFNEAKSKYGFYNKKRDCFHRKWRSPIGLYRVSKIKSNSKQGFCYSYYYYDDYRKRRSLSSVDIIKLKNKVRDHGFEWKVVDEDLVVQNGLSLDDVK